VKKIKRKEEFKISYHNYDLAIKEALSLFENKTLDFLGINAK